MKNIGLFLLGFVFFFQAVAQSEPPVPVTELLKGVGQEAETETETETSVDPARAYPEDAWYQRALDGQISEMEFIDYLHTVLLHYETSEEVWEDALNSLIYVNKKKKTDTAVAVQVQERAHQIFVEVAADFNRTKEQRDEVLNIVSTFSANSAIRILKDFVQTSFSDGGDPEEERGLRRDAVSLIEGIKADSALQALYDLVFFEPLDIKLKEKALDSLEDRKAYTSIRQLAVNPQVSPDMRSAAFQIIVDHGELPQHLKAIALASSAEYEMRSAAIEALEEIKELAFIREIALDPSVDDTIQERAFLTLIALRKERQDRRQQQ